MIGAMLATRSTPALPQRTLLSPVEREDEDGTTSWKRFCREQGRLGAEVFTDRMRAFKEDHSTTTQSDAAMVREFSASMCEHLAALTTTVAEAHGDMSAPSLVSLNSTLTANSVPEPAATATSPSRQGQKHWWQFFTRGKNKRNVGSVKRRKQSAPDRDVVLDQIVSQLNLNDGWERGRMSWTRCRLVLAKAQGNHQLEIYSPYKVRHIILTDTSKCPVCHFSLSKSVYNVPVLPKTVTFKKESLVEILHKNTVTIKYTVSFLHILLGPSLECHVVLPQHYGPVGLGICFIPEESTVSFIC